MKWDTLYSLAVGFLAMRGSVTGDRETGERGKDREREREREIGRDTRGKGKNGPLRFGA